MKTPEGSIHFAIDFGNKQCVLAMPSQIGVDILSSQTSERLIPSQVTFSDHRRYSGELSQQNASQYMTGTIYNIKPLIGLKYHSKEREMLQDRVAYQLVEMENGDTGVEVDYMDQKKKFSIVQILAVLFADLHKIALATNPNARRPVITCEPWWNMEQRSVISDAAKVAGLTDPVLLSSNLAAAISYARSKFNNLPAEHRKAINVAFIDFGENSMNVAITALSRNSVEIIGTGSDPTLGGSSFTDAFVSLIVKKIEEKYHMTIEPHSRLMRRVYNASEKYKKMLSINPVIEFELQNLDDTRDAKFLVTREEFVSVIGHLLQRITPPIDVALNMANKSKDSMYSVEVLGGCNRIPAVKEVLTDYFGTSLSQSLNLDECFALGAGFYASLLDLNRLTFMTFCDIIPYEISYQNNQESDSEVLFKKFSRIPSSKEISTDSQVINLFSEGNKIMRIVLDNTLTTNLQFEIDVGGIISLVSVQETPHRDVDHAVESYFSLPIIKLEQYKKEESMMQQSDSAEIEWEHTRNELESLIYRVNSGLSDDWVAYISPEKREETQNLISSIMLWFERTEFDHPSVEEYKERIRPLAELSQWVTALKAKHNEVKTTKEAFLKNASSLTLAVSKSSSSKDTRDKRNIQNQLHQLVQAINLAASCEKYQMPDYDADKIQKTLRQIQGGIALLR